MVVHGVCELAAQELVPSLVMLVAVVALRWPDAGHRVQPRRLDVVGLADFALPLVGVAWLLGLDAVARGFACRRSGSRLRCGYRASQKTGCHT